MIALEGARVLDGISSDATEDMTIVLDGDRILSVGPTSATEIPHDAEVVDCRGMTALPGLIDMHVHLCAAPNAGPGIPNFLFSEGDLTLWGVAHAQAALGAGFTTLREAFSFHGETGALALRRAGETDVLTLPRIVAAGYAGMTASIVDMRRPPLMDRPYGYTADGPWELRRRTREVIRDGFDWIKTFTSGGRAPGAQEDDTWYTNHTEEELRAIIDEAHNFGVGVMIHATTHEAIRLAVACGADTIEHAWPLNDELIQLMLDHGTVIVPTISVYSERGFLRPEVALPLRTRAERQIESRIASFQLAYEAGVPIANGSDIAPSLPTMRHGDNAFELACMVRYGMSTSDAIRSATSIAARTLGLDGQIGSIEEGKIADVIVVEGNPVADISLLETGLKFVFHRGREVKATVAANKRIPVEALA